MAQERFSATLVSKYNSKPTPVTISIGKYKVNGATSLSADFLDPEYGYNMAWAILSVNLVDEDLPSDQVAIKNYSENEGFLPQLIEQGIVSQPLRYVESGFVTIPICKLLIQPDNGLNQPNAS